MKRNEIRLLGAYLLGIFSSISLNADVIEIDGVKWSYLLTNENNRISAVLTSGIPTSERWWSSSGDTNVRVITPRDVAGKVTVPSEIIGHPVTRVDSGAFYGCSEITELIMPDSIIDIGEDAFAFCSKLKQIHLPLGLKKIEDGMFVFSGLETIRIPDNIEVLGEYLFSHTSVSEVMVGKGVTNLSSATFARVRGSFWEVDDYYSSIERVIFLGDEPSWEVSIVNPTIHLRMDLGFTSATTCYHCYGKKGWDAKSGSWHGANLSKYAYPVIVSPTTSEFLASHQNVSLDCEDADVTIYYTIDGSEPSVANGRKYKGPFDIYQTTTVKAIAVKDDWMDSAVASATFTKANAIGPAINLLEVLPDNDKTHPWDVVTDVTHDGVSAVKSGAIEDEESTTVKAVIYGAGELSFWWKSSCEPSIGGEYYDYGTFYNGTAAVTNIAGVTDWQQVRLAVAGTGKHTFKWTYTKDDSGSTVPDGIWLDQVQWLPETTDYYADHTLTTETPVEYKWLRKYGLGVTNDFEAAAKAKSGKRDGSGRELTVEDDYIAGTDPTNMTSQLTSQIEMIDGVPNITWNPDLEGERTYKIWGSTNLVNGGDWQCPTNALHRFFKVTVEMP